MGIPFGIISAYYHQTCIDYAITLFSYIGISMPTFWLGYILQNIFSLNLHWFESSQRISLELSNQLVKHTN